MNGNNVSLIKRERTGVLLLGNAILGNGAPGSQKCQNRNGAHIKVVLFQPAQRSYAGCIRSYVAFNAMVLQVALRS
jgi:hypothetical protein